MIDEKEVKHIASLARIGVDEEDLKEYSKDLSSILDWMKKMEEVDTENVEPTDHIVGMKNVAKIDKEKKFKEEEKIRDLFPEEKDGYNKVKSVL